MDLHREANVIAAVNPYTDVVIQKSAGYTTNSDGKQVPLYTPLIVSVEIQALAIHELKHLEDLNIQGVTRKLYSHGSVNSIIRAAYEGGDLVIWNCQNWKVVHVFESWPDWSAVAIKRQVDLV